jgi:hypothetical protein
MIALVVGYATATEYVVVFPSEKALHAYLVNVFIPKYAERYGLEVSGDMDADMETVGDGFSEEEDSWYEIVDVEEYNG